MKRRHREFNIFSMSALDLFASAMGAFIIIAVVLFPYYMRNSPSLAQASQMGTEAEQKSKAASEAKARAKLAREQTARAEAARRHADARRAMIKDETKALEEQNRKGGEVLNACQAALAKLDVQGFDLVLVFDTTGSMSSEIVNLRKHLVGIVRVLQKLIPNLRIGLVGYRDDSSYVTRDFALTKMDVNGLARAVAWIKALAAGGGTGSLAVAKGIEAATRMAWRPGVPRAVVVIGDDGDDDAVPHRAMDLARAFSRQSAPASKVSAIAASHGSGSYRNFFYELSKAGGGRFYHDRGQIMESILLTVIDR